MSDVAPGWYPDGSGSERFWDGTEWTDQMRPLQVASAPPSPPVNVVVSGSVLTTPESTRNGLGTSALVLGLIGFFIAVIPFVFGLGGFLGFLALVFGIIGWRRARRGGASNKGVALSGAILGFVAVGAAIINFILTVVLVAAVSTSIGDSISSSSSTPGASVSCAGVTYPDQQSLDTCADATGTVDLKGIKVSASPLRRTTDSLDSKEICDDVTLVNSTASTVDYSEGNFKLQPPSGAIVDSNFGGTFGSGILITGGTKSGQVCFSDSASESGTFVLIYKPNPFEDFRGIWLGSL